MDFKKELYNNIMNPLLLKPARPLPKEAAVIGAGTVGTDIGYYLKSTLIEIKLIVVDVEEESLKKSERQITDYVKKSVDKGKMKEEHGQRILNNIIYTTDYSEIKNADLVVEALTENISIKKEVFSKIEKVVSEDTIITSSTGLFPAGRIFAEMKKPERATVTHFFAPAWRSIPVEVVAWEKVSREVLDYLLWMFAMTGKVAIVTDNVTCLMLERIFNNWCNEAAYLLNDATADMIDHVAEEFVSEGPFHTLNITNGNSAIVDAQMLMAEEGKHYLPASILQSVKSWPTKKTGAQIVVPEDKKNIIRDRLLGGLFSQSFDVVDRGIGLPEELSLGCQIALGFNRGLNG